ncbi:tail fiber assembly protein [Providencia hangzhouensis]|uniref:tail fiber assembly protein n=1 Tax=Providencia hangzhouensis TaxID=3031799 RepID=UPI0034DD0B9A
MITVKHFQRYTPDENDVEKFNLAARGIGFLRDETGRDWYEVQALFAADTIKVQYDRDGIVTNMVQDISTLYPENMSVTEFPRSELPKQLAANGYWCWDGTQFIDKSQSSEVLQQAAQYKKAQLIALATQKIAPLEDAEILRDITDTESTQLAEWRRFRLQVNRIETTLAPHIDWPVPPNL